MNAVASRAGWLATGWQARQAVGLLDVGSSKIACLIIAPAHPSTARGAAGARVLGAGTVPSHGMNERRVVGLEAAELGVRAAVEEAERTAGVRLKDVVLAVTGADLRSHRFTAHTRLSGRLVAGVDRARMMAGARSYAERDGRTVLQLVCHGYRLDDATGIIEPEGLAGQRLAADLGAVTADAAQLRNLLHVIERAYLRPARVAPAPCASALAATSADERRRGVIAADMGAGGTALALFSEGRLAWLGCVPVGGDHITRDIARELGVSCREAERIKRECGTLGVTAADEAAIVLPAGACRNASSPLPVSRERVRALVRDRLIDLCARIAEVVAQSGVAARTPAGAVLSGGASQQPGLPELATPLLGLAVRRARIAQLPGIPAAFANPAFATAVGLAGVALDPAAGMHANLGPAHASGYLTRIGQWLAESF